MSPEHGALPLPTRRFSLTSFCIPSKDCFGLAQWDSISERRAFHHLGVGGLGFSSAKLSAKPAHLASWHADAPGISTRLGMPNIAILTAACLLADARVSSVQELITAASGGETTSR